MIRVERDKVTFYQFLGLRSFPGLSHFVSGREGGVSVGGHAALNLGFMDEDRDDRVLTNRMLLAEAVGCSVDNFTFGEQKHTTHVEVVTRAQRGRGGREKATRLPSTDALITRETGVCLMVLAADCVPVLLYDTRKKVVAAIHAGWRGTVARIVEKTVSVMDNQYGSQGKDLIACIGPSISLEAFEVGDEVYQAFCEAGFDMNQIARKEAKWHIDLWEANRQQLLAYGVKPEHIEISGICTYHNNDDFFSARRQGIRSGRILSGILLGV